MKKTLAALALITLATPAFADTIRIDVYVHFVVPKSSKFTSKPLTLCGDITCTYRNSNMFLEWYPNASTEQYNERCVYRNQFTVFDLKQERVPGRYVGGSLRGGGCERDVVIERFLESNEGKQVMNEMQNLYTERKESSTNASSIKLF